MADYRYQIPIIRVGARPPFGEVVGHVFGVGANVDTDGDSATPAATDWTWLYMCRRPTRNSPVVEVTLVDGTPGGFLISSDDEELAKRTAEFLS